MINSRLKSTTRIDEFEYDNRTQAHTSEQIVESLNQYYSNVFTADDYSSMPP